MPRIHRTRLCPVAIPLVAFIVMAVVLCAPGRVVAQEKPADQTGSESGWEEAFENAYASQPAGNATGDANANPETPRSRGAARLVRIPPQSLTRPLPALVETTRPLPSLPATASPNGSRDSLAPSVEKTAARVDVASLAGGLPPATSGIIDAQGVEQQSGPDPFSLSILDDSIVSDVGKSTLAPRIAPESRLEGNPVMSFQQSMAGGMQIEEAGAPTAPMSLKRQWWEPVVTTPLAHGGKHIVIDPDGLVHQALANSPAILAVSQTPLIQEQAIVVAEAGFDVEMFLQTRYDDRVDPVGNQLTTGGLPFLEDNIWAADAGLRKKLVSGADVELKQHFGFQNSNSRFFDPQDQGTATLSFDVSQPLMRGRGECYNRSQIVLAQINSNVAWDKLSEDIQQQISQLVEAYWTLYYARSVLLQKQHNVDRGRVVLEKIEGRSTLDSLPSQIARARAAVRARETQLAVAQRDVLNAESRIRQILGSPDAFQANAPELVPVEGPVFIPNPIALEQAISEAIQQRPEVLQALGRARAAEVQQNVSRNELMPELNLLFSSYVAALRGESDVLGAWTDQFRASTPGFGAGLEFAMPYGRRAARARLTRQQLVVQQIRHEIDQSIHEVVADVQTAWRRVESAWQTAQASVVAIDAAHADLEQNQARWEAFALIEGDLMEGQNPTTLLDQLLDAQQRLVDAELTFSQAVMEYKVAEVDLKRAMGTLLRAYSTNADQATMPIGSTRPANPPQGQPISAQPPFTNPSESSAPGTPPSGR